MSGPDDNSELSKRPWDPAGTQVSFRVASSRATRIELDIFAQPTGAPPVLTRNLDRDSPPAEATWSWPFGWRSGSDRTRPWARSSSIRGFAT